MAAAVGAVAVTISAAAAAAPIPTASPAPPAAAPAVSRETASAGSDTSSLVSLDQLPLSLSDLTRLLEQLFGTAWGEEVI
jgi:hypothetical protein